MITYQNDGKGGWKEENGTKTTYKQFCSHDNSLAYTSKNKNIEIDGASLGKLTVFGYDYVFNMAGTNQVKKVQTSPDFIQDASDPIWKDLNQYKLNYKIPTVIDLNWPDMGVPYSATKELWQHLVDMIPQDSVIVATCMGGHGRTGSFIAILAGLLDGLKGKKAIDTVRKNYCECAVETSGQEEYICKILG